MLNGIQGVVAEAIHEMLDYALVRLAEVSAQQLLATEDEVLAGIDHPVTLYDLGLPEIGGRDANRDLQALVQYTTSLDIAQSRKWVTPRKASELFQNQVRAIIGAQFGPEDTPEDVDLDEDRLVELSKKLQVLDQAAAGPKRDGDPGDGGDAISRAREEVLRELGRHYPGRRRAG
jgi:hypothetical protein